jgi:hypothetical protein
MVLCSSLIIIIKNDVSPHCSHGHPRVQNYLCKHQEGDIETALHEWLKEDKDSISLQPGVQSNNWSSNMML